MDTNEEMKQMMDPFYAFFEKALNKKLQKEGKSLEDKFELLQKRLEEKLSQLEKEGKLKSEKLPNGIVRYYSVDSEPEVPEEKPEEPVEESSTEFVMTKEDFVKFVKEYQDFMNAFAKVKHIFGIDFNADGANWSFYDQANKLIWGLLGVIFGTDNLDDISAFCFGDSNFDSAEQLYDELT